TVLAGTGIHALPPGWGATARGGSGGAPGVGLRASCGDVITLFAAPRRADGGVGVALAVV
ncbi:hypothetical protein PUR57_00095, partial [Streptomyces sp. JV176]|uniref:hypothetical protein n=1 Tax=Streptomyces sp. JV176 TaxID=858630 RepID=UPI002E75D143